jgi:hypothetical protein
MAQNLGADGVRFAVGEGEIGVVALHLGLPVALKSGEDLALTAVFEWVEWDGGQAFLRVLP